MTQSISVIILNWNRARLLDRCLVSLHQTFPDYEDCIVIDNASADESADVIRSWCERSSRLRALMKPENRGAEWINEAIHLVRSELIFILANDKVLLPGWVDYARSVFCGFPEIGQLALHAPAPLDDEIWVTKPARFHYRSGVGVYEALGNTGMSSILRRSLIASGKILFHNLPGAGEVKLPDDGRLSKEIRDLGFLSAWSDRYYCLNEGHTAQQFEADDGYYAKNYAAKPWLGLEGLTRRVAEHRSMPKPSRSSRVFGWSGIPECEQHETLSERAWSILDGGGPELEAMDFIYGLCRLIKPRDVLLVRGWTGHAAVAVARALADNGLGRLVVLEPNSDLRTATRQRLDDAAIVDMIEIVEVGDGLGGDLVILAGYFEETDSAWLDILWHRLASSTRYVLVQTAALPSETRERLDKVLAAHGWSGVSLLSPRRLMLLARNDQTNSVLNGRL